MPHLLMAHKSLANLDWEIGTVICQCAAWLLLSQHWEMGDLTEFPVRAVFVFPYDFGINSGVLLNVTDTTCRWPAVLRR